MKTKLLWTLMLCEALTASPADYGLERLREVLRSKGAGDAVVMAGIASEQSPATEALHDMKVALPQGPEALVIRRATRDGKPALVLCGSDSRALMYAALDAAQRVSWSTDPSAPFQFVRDTDEHPFVRERMVSMYTMQRAYLESRLYDPEYWKSYFDLLAASRINTFHVVFGYENGGFLAPVYPYFFNVDGFADVEMVGLTREQQDKNTDAFRTMIRLAHERGIDVTVGIWDHIYRGGVQGGGIPGASENAGKRVPGLVWGVTTENLETYTKAALAKFVRVFPEIDGIQFRMHSESGLKPSEMQQFWHEVFGILKTARPGLRIDLRVKDLPDSIIEDAIAQGLNARVSTKYWMEQMGLPYHPVHVNRENQHDRRHGYADLLRYPQHYRVHWTLWNGGTARLLLWGDPEYVRRFAASAHLYDGDSLEVNEMLATKMLGEPHERPPVEILNPGYRYYKYEFERYWHFYQLWGRVSYNPDTPAEVWEREFQRRLGASGRPLMEALHLASNVLPRIVAASYRYQLFPTTRGWAEMMREGDLPKYADMEGSDTEQFMSARAAARSILDGTDSTLRRPEETSRWFADRSRRILDFVRTAEVMSKGAMSKEMISTTADLKILAHLADYHSHRLLAGVDYNLYKLSGDLFALDDAIVHERNAVGAWERIVEAAGDIYNSELPFGAHAVGFSRHWSEELRGLQKGLDDLTAERKAAQPPPSVAHVPVRRASPREPVIVRASGGRGDMRVVVVRAEGRHEQLRMRETSPGMYQAEVAARGSGPMEYFIEANGMKTPMVKVLSVTDDRPPEVRLDRPAEAKPGVDLRVTARAGDPSGVKSMRLRYRHVNQYEDYQTATMALDAATGLYAATIPGSFITPEWDVMYFVEALDTAGNGRNYPDLEKEAPYVIVPVAR